MPRRASREAGFVITLEMIIIFTILGIGLLAGIFAVRNALFVWLMKQKAQTVWVYDQSGLPLGPARDFDEHETPRLFYIDRDVEWPAGGGETHNYRAFIGVRDDRFTTRHRIYYHSADCSASDPPGDTVCIAKAGEETDDNDGVGFVGTDAGQSPITYGGGIGYLYPLQRGPSYGVGSDLDNPGAGSTCSGGPNDGDPCADSTDCGAVLACSNDPLTPCAVDLDCGGICVGGPDAGDPCTQENDCAGGNNSSCVAQFACVPTGGGACLAGGGGFPGTLYRETDTACDTTLIQSRWTSQHVGPPCEPYTIDAEVAAAFCPKASGCGPSASPICVDTPDACNCPDGWYRATGINGNNCCPIGSEFIPNGQTGSCREAGGDIVVAEPVQIRIETGPGVFADVNALSVTTPPFFVNLPPGPDSFSYINPTAEGGAPGSSTGIPYTPADFVFDRAPNDSTELESQ